jgi:hypothetical protein
MPTDQGPLINWRRRYWHDWWPDVMKAVYKVAAAHARYLGYEIYQGLFAWGADCEPPPGDLETMGPVVPIRLVVFRRTGKHHSKPDYEVLYVDVERRPGGKLHPKTGTILRK